jgi:hypothetical protein
MKKKNPFFVVNDENIRRWCIVNIPILYERNNAIVPIIEEISKFFGTTTEKDKIKLYLKVWPYYLFFKNLNNLPIPKITKINYWKYFTKNEKTVKNLNIKYDDFEHYIPGDIKTNWIKYLENIYE